MRILVIFCNDCGAVFNFDLLARIQENSSVGDFICPACYGKYKKHCKHHTYVLLRMYEVFANDEGFNSEIECIYISFNSCGNSRLIIRMADHYLIKRTLPEDFTLIQTRADSPAPSPVELIFTIDVNLNPGSPEFNNELNLALQFVQTWLDDKLYLKFVDKQCN